MPQRQSEGFDFGVYGSARGGGSSPEAARVDLVGGLRALAKQLPKEVSVADWFPQANSLFSSLRDAHVDWRNGGTKLDAVLNQFIFVLEEERSGKVVRVEVESEANVVLDGFAKPIMRFGGKELRSVGGLEPMERLGMSLGRPSSGAQVV